MSSNNMHQFGIFLMCCMWKSTLAWFSNTYILDEWEFPGVFKELRKSFLFCELIFFVFLNASRFT